MVSAVYPIFHFHVLQFIICIEVHDMKMWRSEMSPLHSVQEVKIM